MPIGQKSLGQNSIGLNFTFLIVKISDSLITLSFETPCISVTRKINRKGNEYNFAMRKI